jgi:EpsD family peptidyl-prolyl cis-trans isomerase
MFSGTNLVVEIRSLFVRVSAPLVGVVIVAGLLVGCGGGDKKEKTASQTAAKVNKEEITVHQINNVLQQQRGLKPEMAASASVQVLERLIDQELAIQKAQEQKIDRDPRVVQQIESARREIISRAYIEKVGSGVPTPTPAEIKAYFDSKPALFSARKVYSFQELMIEADAGQITALREALAAAKDINAFAEYLKANNFKFGGNQASRAAEQLPLASLDEIAKMKNGQALFSVTPKGAQVTVLAGTRDQPVDEVRAQPAIEQFLLNERKRKVVEDDLKALRKAAKIEYVGDYAGGAPKSLEEKLNVSPTRSPLVDSSASAAEYVPPAPAPLASAPVDTTPAEPFAASAPTGKALEMGLKGFK